MATLDFALDFGRFDAPILDGCDICCPECHAWMHLSRWLEALIFSGDTPLKALTCPVCGKTFSELDGRYLMVRW